MTDKVPEVPTTTPKIVDNDFRRFFRFGTIDNSLLVFSMMCGMSIDAFLARRIGVKGYGTMLGACVGNSISDGVAASPEGRNAAIGALVGSAMPLAPVFVAMAFKAPFESRNVRIGVGLSSAAFLGLAFGMRSWFDRDDKEQDK
ncbi:hypothetical protein AKO1_009155 [Acrasis kona]|uniref:Uncharacterized protein n=1 Tax=Acrasis kona TaxID=1008807 RepID=A0AAW2ZL75_9EUKA